MEPNAYLNIEPEDLDVVGTVTTDDGYQVKEMRIYFRQADVTEQFSKAELMRLEERLLDMYVNEIRERRSALNTVLRLANGEAV